MRSSLVISRPADRPRFFVAACAGISLCCATAAWGQASVAAQHSEFVEVVRAFADNVLRHGRDVYGPRQTPLFVDGISIDTHEPATWKLPPECARIWRMPRQWIMSDLACQQVLFRVFDLLTALTNDPKYREAAIDAFRYHFEHLQHEDGLLFWGGHAMIDAATDQPVGEGYKDRRRRVPIPAFWDAQVQHELKHHYPCYDLMWEADPQATRRFIEGFWSAHVLRWDNLDFNRHGLYGRYKGYPWDHKYVGGPLPVEMKGLTLFDGGCELMYAAVQLHRLSGDPRPLVWAKRLAQRYADVRDPRTGLGPDVYGYYRNELYLEQFGPEFGDRFTETSHASIYGIRYGYAPLCQLQLAAQLGPAGEEFKRHAVADLTALATYCYDPRDNRIWYMLTDGTRLSPTDVRRPGMFSPDAFHKRPLGGVHLYAYTLAYRLTGDPLMWSMARRIARSLDLGDIGEPSGADRRLKLHGRSPSPLAIFGLIELARITGDRAFLEVARSIGRALVDGQLVRGFFVPSKRHAMCQFDTVTPLALLHLDIAVHGLPIQPPPFFGNDSFFLCPYDGRDRTYSGLVFNVKR